MSHAQQNHELRNYEYSVEHSITSTPGTQAAGATPNPLRSSLLELQTLLRSRACGLSDLRLRRSHFTSNRTLHSRVDAIEVCPPEVRIAGGTWLRQRETTQYVL
jgi:hypothetical protein